jgi:hypothetical protein
MKYYAPSVWNIAEASDFGSILSGKGGCCFVEEYLTITELSKRIKMHPGTIRNLIWKKKLVETEHFVRPTPRKILFRWSAIENWLNGRLSPPHNHPIQSKINI